MNRKTIIRVYADSLLEWMYDSRDGLAELACEVMKKLGSGKMFTMQDVKPGFIPSNFIANPGDINLADQEEIDDEDFEFIPDEHEDNYEIEWIFGDS